MKIIELLLIVFMLSAIVGIAEDETYISYDDNFGAQSNIPSISAQDINFKELSPENCQYVTLEQVQAHITEGVISSEQFAYLDTETVVKKLSPEDCQFVLNNLLPSVLNPNLVIAMQIADPNIKLTSESGMLPEGTSIIKNEQNGYTIKTGYGEVLNFDPNFANKIQVTDNGLMLNDKYFMYDGQVQMKQLDEDKGLGTTEYVFETGSACKLNNNILITSGQETSVYDVPSGLTTLIDWSDTNQVRYESDGWGLQVTGNQMTIDLETSAQKNVFPEMMDINAVYGIITVNGPQKEDGTYVTCSFGFGSVSCENGDIGDLGVHNIYVAKLNENGDVQHVSYYQFQDKYEEPICTDEYCTISCQASICAYGDSTPTIKAIADITGMAEESTFDKVCSGVASFLRFGSAPPKAEATPKTEPPPAPPKTTQPTTPPKATPQTGDNTNYVKVGTESQMEIKTKTEQYQQKMQDQYDKAMGMNQEPKPKQK